MNLDDIAAQLGVLNSAAKESKKTWDTVGAVQPEKTWSNTGQRQNPPVKVGYTIENKDTGNSAHINVTFDPATNEKLKVEEIVGPDNIITYNTPRGIDDFFNELQKYKNISVYSAPIDNMAPADYPEEFYEGATAYYDSTVDGEAPYYNVISLDNPGLPRFGTRRAKRFNTKYGPYVSFEDAYRDERLQSNTANNAMWGWELDKSYNIPDNA